MFDFLKKNKQLELYAPASGELKSITEVNDPVFADKLIGDGYAVIPTIGDVTSPVIGKISTIFPTKHAIGITTPQGDEVLVHIGIDTVELKGEPFESVAKIGDKVSKNSIIAKVDLQKLIELKKDTSIIVVFTSGRILKNSGIHSGTKVEKGDIVGII